MSDDPGFLNEQRALYQTIRRAREALSVVLQVVALAVAPSIVNMVNVLGNVAEIQNFLRITKINLWSNLATRGRGVHLHTLVDRDAEALQERG